MYYLDDDADKENHQIILIDYHLNKKIDKIIYI